MSKEELTQEHLIRIGKRFRGIRKSKNINQLDFTEMLSLKGGALQRFENGHGIQIINLLSIITWLDEEGYNIKWLLLYDNEGEFQLKSDGISTLSGFGNVADILRKQEIVQSIEELIQKTEKIKITVNKL